MTKSASKPHIKAASAIIAWTPAYDFASKTCGQVIVGEWVPRRAPHWALAFANMAGAVTGARRSLTEADALKALGRDFKQLRADGIPADAINEAFAKIEGWQAR